MQYEHFFNLSKQDWTDHNLQVLKYCKEQAYKSVLDFTVDYPATPHLPVVRGVLAWDRLDYYLDAASRNRLFEGIASRWIKYQGASILELRGKYTSLTACHVLSRDDNPKESDYGYRKNNRAKNQKNQELFKQFEAPASEEDVLNLVMKHGGRDDNFAFLIAYLEDEDIPHLTNNIMLMPALEMTPETEIVPTPMPTLKPTAVPTKEISTYETADKTDNDHSQS